jgi:hypothetical protein
VIDLSTNIADVVRQLNATANEIAPATETALDRFGQVVLNAKRRNVQRTYARPIPRGKNGKPKWKRSGDYLKGQEIISETGQRTIRTGGKAAEPITNYPGGYAQKLQTLPASKDGVARANPDVEDTARIVGEQAEKVFTQEFRNAIRSLR